MSNEEKQVTTVFIEGQLPKVETSRIRVPSPYERDTSKSSTREQDTSVTRQQEREHRLHCLKMAVSAVQEPDQGSNEVINLAKRFWQFVREGN